MGYFVSDSFDKTTCKKLILQFSVISQGMSYYSKSPHIKAGLKYVLISKALRLISGYGGSWLKGDLCRPFRSHTKDCQSFFCFRRFRMDPTLTGKETKNLTANWDKNELSKSKQISTLLPLQ